MKAIAPAVQGRLDFLRDRQSAKHFDNGPVEKRIGYREEAHEEQRSFLAGKSCSRRKFFAEVSAGQRRTDQFRRLAATHRHDRENRHPAAKFLFAEEREGVTYAANFPAQPQRWGIQVAQQPVEQGRLLLEKFFDGTVAEFRCGNRRQQLKMDKFVAGDVAGLDHGRPAEKIALEETEAEMASLRELAFGLDFLRKQGNVAVTVFSGETFAAAFVEQLEIHFEEMRQLDEGLKPGRIDEVVESEEVALVAKLTAQFDVFFGGLNGFEDFHDDTIGGQQSSGAQPQCQPIYVDESP